MQRILILNKIFDLFNRFNNSNKDLTLQNVDLLLEIQQTLKNNNIFYYYITRLIKTVIIIYLSKYKTKKKTEFFVSLKIFSNFYEKVYEFIDSSTLK